MKSDLKKLRDQLRCYRGSIKEIEARSGMSSETVRQVLSGSWRNPRVLAIASVVLKERKNGAPLVTSAQAEALMQEAIG